MKKSKGPNGAKMVPNDQQEVYWPFWAILNPFEALTNLPCLGVGEIIEKKNPLANVLAFFKLSANYRKKIYIYTYTYTIKLSIDIQNSI